MPPTPVLPRIIAHRGGKFWEGENFSYISDSIRQGADIIELDVGALRNGRYVIQHDQFSRAQGYLDDALARLENAALYLDVKDRMVDIHKLIAHVHELCTNHLILGSDDSSLLRGIKDLDAERTYHCVLPWKALSGGKTAMANWITPLCYVVTERLARGVQQAGFKFVPGGNPLFKRHELMENQLQYARWGAYAISTYHVKQMRYFLQANL